VDGDGSTTTRSTSAPQGSHRFCFLDPVPPPPAAFPLVFRPSSNAPSAKPTARTPGSTMGRARDGVKNPEDLVPTSGDENRVAKSHYPNRLASHKTLKPRERRVGLSFPAARAARPSPDGSPVTMAPTVPHTVKDVPAQEFVIALAQYFRSTGKVRYAIRWMPFRGKETPTRGDARERPARRAATRRRRHAPRVDRVTSANETSAPSTRWWSRR